MSISSLNLHPYFATGDIYKKDNHIILLLGDLHISRNNNQAKTINIIQRQLNDLSQNIKKYQKEDTLIIIENPRDPHVGNNNEKIKNILDNMPEEEKAAEPEIILFEIAPKLEKENREVKNVEYRYMELLFAIDKGNIAIKDIIDEMNTQINTIKEYEKEILASNFEHKQHVADFYNEQITSHKIKDHLAFLKQYESKTYPFSLTDIVNENPLFPYSIKNPDHMEKMQIIARGVNTLLNPNYSLLDATIVHTIIKNREKKIMIICTGALHTHNVSKVLENIGYTKLIEHKNPAILEQIFDHPEQIVNPAQLIAELSKIDPIEVKDFFEPIFAHIPYA